jgi:hypothetical protein
MEMEEQDLFRGRNRPEGLRHRSGQSVREEFREQDILYPEAPEDSDGPPGEQETP